MSDMVSKKIYGVSIDNIWYASSHYNQYIKNKKPTFVIVEYTIESEDDRGAGYIPGLGWVNQKDLNHSYIGKPFDAGILLLDSLSKENLEKAIKAFEEHLIFSLKLCSTCTDGDCIERYYKIVLKEFGLTRKDLIKALYTLSCIKSLDDLTKAEYKLYPQFSDHLVNRTVWFKELI